MCIKNHLFSHGLLGRHRKRETNGCAYIFFDLCWAHQPFCPGTLERQRASSEHLCSQAGTGAGIVLCSTCGRLLRLGRLFNLSVASFPHLLRGDNVPEGDLPPWDAARLIDLMLLLLTWTEGGWAGPARDQAQNKLSRHQTDASWDLGHHLLCCPWHRGGQFAIQGPLGFPPWASSGGWGLEDENGIWRTSGPVELKGERPDSCWGHGSSCPVSAAKWDPCHRDHPTLRTWPRSRFYLRWMTSYGKVTWYSHSCGHDLGNVAFYL